MPDFQRIIIDMIRIFGSVRQIGRLLNYRNPDYLTKLSRGEIADPRYSLGCALIDLYKKHVAEELPIIGGFQQRNLLK